MQANVLGNAVQDVSHDTNNNGDTNARGSQPIGDNAGAFAHGFTTGPDAFAVSFNGTNGTATVTLDQRVADCVGSDIVLLRNDGTDLGNPSGTSGNSCSSGVTIPGFGTTSGSTDEDVVLQQIQKITTNTNTSTTDNGGDPANPENPENPGNPQNPGNPENPPNPVPTPEPGTLLLVGGGVISITLRRLRSRRQGPTPRAR